MATVLIVDDSKLTRKMLFGMLTDMGHQVVGEAENGRIGCEMYATLHPDVVTLDINMPDMDGIAAVRNLIAGDPDARIIMVSSIDDRAITYECIGAGALDFINKPVQFEKLRDKIELLLAT